MKNNNQQQATHGILDVMTAKITKNKKSVLIISVIIIALAAAATVFTHFKNEKYQREWGNLFLAELSFVESADSSLSALEGFTAANENTPAGAYAAFTLGNAHYQAKDFVKAERYFKQAMEKGNKELASLSQVSLIAALISQNLYDGAIEQANVFAAKYPTHFAMAQVNQYKALAQELAGKKEEAKEGYKKLTEEFPNTYYSAFAELRLEALK